MLSLHSHWVSAPIYLSTDLSRARRWLAHWFQFIKLYYQFFFIACAVLLDGANQMGILTMISGLYLLLMFALVPYRFVLVVFN